MVILVIPKHRINGCICQHRSSRIEEHIPLCRVASITNKVASVYHERDILFFGDTVSNELVPLHLCE